jgi:hypothetical protein
MHEKTAMKNYRKLEKKLWVMVFIFCILVVACNPKLNTVPTPTEVTHIESSPSLRTPEPTPLSTTPTAFSGRIITFTVSPTKIAQGGNVTLTWEVTEGQTVICPMANLQYAKEECFEVPLSGTQVVTTAKDATVYEFALEVRDSGPGWIDRRSEYVCVDVSDWVVQNPPYMCAAAPPIYSRAVAQRFEHGVMIWVEDVNHYIAFFDSGDDRAATFTSFFGPLELKPGTSVDNRVGDVPPGYFEPVGDFGLIWRGEVEEGESLRSILGWALEPRFEFETVYQRGIETIWHYCERVVRDPDGRFRYFWRQAHIGGGWCYLED